MNKEKREQVAIRVLNAKCSVCEKYPFFGRLIMRVPVLLRDSSSDEKEFTASTDMTRICIGTDFAYGISDEQIIFVLLHEVMHCVLKHCTRGVGLILHIYNLACDIVVNSLLLELMGIEEMEIKEVKLMHLTPDNREGRLFTAEEVYEMLLNQSEGRKESAEGQTLDIHDKWDELSDNSMADDKWDFYVKDASIKTNGNLPLGIKRYIDNTHRTLLDWRQVLHDFIQFSAFDFLFAPPDRRFQDDFIIPAFSESRDWCSVEKVWFCVDTSGSVSRKALSEVMREIRGAAEQLDNISGAISFFDAAITKPHSFDSIETLDAAIPTGGGGTNFLTIFKNINKFFGNNHPKCIIIMTDGLAHFPKEKEACGIPVLWIINNSNVIPPFGTIIHLDKQL